MRIHDLKIETFRQAPSNAKTIGFAFLVRAGYLTRGGGMTLLGEQSLTRLRGLKNKSSNLFSQLSLDVFQTETGETFFEIASGNNISVLYCPACHYADRAEIARSKKQAMPDEQVLPIEKIETPACNTIESLANFLGIPKEKTAKALMYTRLSDNQFVFVAVRGDMQLSELKLKKLIGEIRLATAEEIIKSGAAAGYASPIGLKNSLVIVDDLIPISFNLAAGANETGYHFINTNYGRDYSAEIVADVVRANPGEVCPNCGSPLISKNAEVMADETGINYENILEASAEVHHDEKGLTLPACAAPFDVYLMQLAGKEIDTKAKADELYSTMQNAGISVLFDDRPERAGVKFNDADLIGLPLRVTLGEKNLKEGMVELKARKSTENKLVPVTEIINSIQSLLKTLK